MVLGLRRRLEARTFDGFGACVALCCQSSHNHALHAFKASCHVSPAALFCSSPSHPGAGWTWAAACPRRATDGRQRAGARTSACGRSTAPLPPRSDAARRGPGGQRHSSNNACRHGQLLGVGVPHPVGVGWFISNGCAGAFRRELLVALGPLCE